MRARLPQTRMSVDEFLAWAAEQPGRYELENGLAIAMSPERALHAEVKASAYIALRGAVQRSGVPCRAMPDGMTVRIEHGTAFEPDALVYCGPRLPDDAVEVAEPVIVVEVLSPGTAQRDFGAKLAGYFAVDSIRHYLIADPERRLLIHHARGDGDLIVTRIVSGSVLRLDPPGLDLAVAEFFSRD